MGGSAGPGDTEFDSVYSLVWNDLVERCHRQLEPDDYTQALQISDIHCFRGKLSDLQLSTQDHASRQVLALLFPALDHYEAFSGAFVSMMEGNVDVSLMWGLLYLLLKLSLSTTGSIERISTMLRDIGFKIHLLQGYVAFLPMSKDTKLDALEVNKEIILLWLNVICMFRDPINNLSLGEEMTWVVFWDFVKHAEQNIDKAVARAEKVYALKAAADAKTHQDEVEHLRRLLNLDSSGRETNESRSRFHNIPFPQNPRFFGRQDYIKRIDAILKPSGSVASQFSSVVLHGLGGVGKTQIALEYAYGQAQTFDAVFWIPSENRDRLLNTFSQIATSNLRLEGAKEGAHTENRILVLNWLRQTALTWVVVFDNAESTDTILPYWPISTKGAALITTRNPNVARHLAKESIEVQTFDAEHGADFLSHLLKLPVNSHSDATEHRNHATELSALLGGHPLALNQMAAFILSRGITIQEFTLLYKKSPQRLHHQKKDGAAAYGYSWTISTVWSPSYTILDENSRVILGVIAMIAPEKIPLKLFRPSDDNLPSQLQFCKDDFGLDDAIEALLELSLVNKESGNRTLHVHRLVQAEFLHQSTAPQRQSYFDNATDLLLRGLSVVQARVLRYWESFPDYIQHLLKLVDIFKFYQNTGSPLKPGEKFCKLVGKFCWGLNENYQQPLVSDLLSVSFTAFDSMQHSTPVESNLLYSYLRNFAGSINHEQGYFDLAITHYEIALRIRKSNGTEPRKVCNTQANLGSALASRGDIAQALGIVREGMAICDEHFEDTSVWQDTRLLLLWTQAEILGYSRDEIAKDKVDEIFELPYLQDASHRELTTHLIAAKVYYHLSMLPDAWVHIGHATRLAQPHGPVNFNTENAMCRYVKGCLEMKISNPERAFSHMQEAYTIMELSGLPRGVRGLCLHRIACLIRLVGGDESEAKSYEARAIRELQKLKQGNVDGSFIKLEDFVSQVPMEWRL